MCPTRRPRCTRSASLDAQHARADTSRSRAPRLGVTSARQRGARSEPRSRHAQVPQHAGAHAHRVGPGDARGRAARGLHRLPGAALDRARSGQGRHPLPSRRHPRGGRGTRDADDLEMRRHGPAARRRERRRCGRSAQAHASPGRTAHEAIHRGDPADHRPRARHPGARCEHRRIDDGVDRRHRDDDDRAAFAGSRDRKADRARRLARPH